MVPNPLGVSTQTNMALLQLTDLCLYLLFAPNEHFVLSRPTPSQPSYGATLCWFRAFDNDGARGSDVFWKFWKWNSMVLRSVGFVYVGATMRLSFLAEIAPKAGIRTMKRGISASVLYPVPTLDSDGRFKRNSKFLSACFQYGL